METVKKGDTIRFLNARGGGKVISLDEGKNLAYVETEDGFVIPTLFAECVVVSSQSGAGEYSVQARRMAAQGPSAQQMAAKSKADEANKRRAIGNEANGKKEARQDETMEVDLHIAALLPGRNDIAASEILPYQIKAFRKVMQAEIRHRGKRIVFIHGNGEGVLKKQLQTILHREYPTCLTMEARMQKYGTGATMVVIN